MQTDRHRDYRDTQTETVIDGQTPLKTNTCFVSVAGRAGNIYGQSHQLTDGSVYGKQTLNSMFANINISC